MSQEHHNDDNEECKSCASTTTDGADSGDSIIMNRCYECNRIMMKRCYECNQYKNEIKELNERIYQYKNLAMYYEHKSNLYDEMMLNANINRNNNPPNKMNVCHNKNKKIKKEISFDKTPLNNHIDQNDHNLLIYIEKMKEEEENKNITLNNITKIEYKPSRWISLNRKKNSDYDGF